MHSGQCHPHEAHTRGLADNAVLFNIFNLHDAPSLNDTSRESPLTDAGAKRRGPAHTSRGEPSASNQRPRGCQPLSGAKVSPPEEKASAPAPARRTLAPAIKATEGSGGLGIPSAVAHRFHPRRGRGLRVLVDRNPCQVPLTAGRVRGDARGPGGDWLRLRWRRCGLGLRVNGRDSSRCLLDGAAWFF